MLKNKKMKKNPQKNPNNYKLFSAFCLCGENSIKNSIKNWGTNLFVEIN